MAVLLLTVGLAGCLGGADDTDSTADGLDTPEQASLLERMTADGADHDHANPAEHDVAYDMEMLDHEPLAEPGKQSGTHALAIREDLLFAASTLGDDPGFSILDVSDPNDMTVLGEFRQANAVGGDRSITVSEDGQWVFLANEGDLENMEPGIRVIDVSDPTSPEQVSYLPVEGGVHTIETITLDGTIYVFALNYGVQTFQLVETPTGPQLVKVGQYTLAGTELANPPQYDNPGNYPSWGLRAVYAHDMRAFDDPEAGPLLYIAYAYQGLQVLSIENPAAPQPVGDWVPGGDAAPWYTHTVEAQWIGDRRIVVVGSEVFEARHNETASPLWILDMTDLAEPELLSTWTNPAGTGSQELLFSAHFFRMEDGIIHLSHYHGGVWQIDVSTPAKQVAPEILGAYLPSQDTGFEPASECCLGFNLAGIPVTMDAVAKDGVTFAADYQTGIYALKTTG